MTVIRSAAGKNIREKGKAGTVSAPEPSEPPEDKKTGGTEIHV